MWVSIKVGVNHGIFHVYHFWNFLIFKCTWVCSSSSSKNKNIFLNLSINSINLKMSIYLSISKMCSSLFSRGNQACALIANTKRRPTTQSWGAALSAIYIKGTRLTFELARWPWHQFASLKTTVKFMTFVEEYWTHISWFYGYYRLDLDETDAKLDALFCPQCVQMTGIFLFPHGSWGHFQCCLWPLLNKNIVFYEFILRQQLPFSGRSGLFIMQRRGKLLVLSDRDPFFLGGVFSFFQI